MNNDEIRQTRKQQRGILWTIVIVILILILFSCFFIVDETQFGVVTRFGRPLAPVRTSGLNVKLPWPIDYSIILDRRILQTALPVQELLTSDQKNVNMTSFVLWQITDPTLFAATMQDLKTAETRLSDIAIAQIAISVGKVPFNLIINLEGGKSAMARILKEASDELSRVAKEFGIDIRDLGITSFLLPPQNRTSVIERMVADRNRLATFYRSSGTEEALKIEGEAAAEHEKILGKAHGESTAIKGRGEAEALKILAEAYRQDPEFYFFIRSLDSYEAIIGKQSTVFIEADSPLLKYFNGTGAKELLKE